MDLVNHQTITKDKSKSQERKKRAILVAMILVSFILMGSTIINGSVMAIKIKQHRQFGPPPPMSGQAAERGSSNITQLEQVHKATGNHQAAERGSSNITQLQHGNKTTGNLTTGQPAAPGNSSVYIR